MTDPRSMDAAALLAAIVESSDDAIVGKSLDGTVLTWNGGAERIFGYSAEEMIGQSIRRLIPDDRQDEEDRIIASVSGGQRVPTFETVRLRKDGSEVEVAVTVSPVRDADGQIIAASKIARDISQRKAMQSRLEESEHHFRLLADNISQLAWIADGKGWIFWYNKRWFDYTGTTLSDMEGWGWKSVHHPDHVDRVVARVQHSWDTGELWEDTFPLRGADGEYRWFLSRALPIRNDAGVIQYWFGTNTDVTEMRNAEKRIELLLMEVNHRSKNMLAVVQSLARRTLTKGGEELERLEQRIHSMAASQDLLVHRAWSSIPVREMVQAQLAFVEDSVRDQVRFDGPAINLSPAAAEAISMALHEMATNALKYGALSDMAGKVTIAWGVDPEENFWIEWRESGGPAVKQPEKKGFGSRVIEDVPRGKLDGNVRIEFAEHGFSWRLDCPSHRCVGDTLEDSPTVRSED